VGLGGGGSKWPKIWRKRLATLITLQRFLHLTMLPPGRRHEGSHHWDHRYSRDCTHILRMCPWIKVLLHRIQLT
jgi:hypothetical protein